VKLTGFVLGIRINKSFFIEDKLGAIIDDILYSENSELNNRLFNEISSNATGKVVYNAHTGNKLTVSAQDIIFEYNIEKDFDIEFDKYLKNFNLIILKKVFGDYQVKNIHRFGFVIKAELSKSDTLIGDISKVIKSHYSGDEDSFTLRFNMTTKKPITIKGIITEDYDNEIITYDKVNQKSPTYFSADYQKYFKPELALIKDATIPFDTFCKNSLQSFKQKYLGEEKR